jgi:hypothetical protein
MDVDKCRSLRSFRPSSTLFTYLISKKTNLIREECLRYRLSTVRLALELIINREGLFDPCNREIIVCDCDLEQALDRKTFHCSQSIDIIEEHLLESTDTDLLTSSRLCQAEINFILRFYERRLTFPEKVLVNFDVRTTYHVNPELMQLIRPFGDFNKTPVQSYEKVVNAVSSYILSRKHLIFDLRNIRIANVKNDPISHVFGVQHFASFQTRYLIRSQLKRVRRSTRIKRLCCCRFC